MKQVLQNLRDGATEVVEVAAPRARAGGLLIRTRASVISSGTERMLVEFGRAGWIDKARSQPEKVRQVLDKVKTDGLLQTLDAVQSKLDQPLPLGYSSAGVVLDVGAGVSGFQVGDRVVSNGPHAELATVPANLCAKIPAGVDDESAAFTVIASIALQGVRLAQPTLGECFVVTGLGLIGLIAVQLLRAQGCRVLGIDFDKQKQALARRYGAETVDLSANEDPISAAQQFSRGRGVDGVLITAATKSSEPMHQAALMCRKRGRIVLVGTAGLELSRADFYEKELSFQVSCSYGPGRYDPQYEDEGHDYPIGFVRWTEQRNFEAVLDMLASRALDVESLIAHRFPIEEAAAAYDVLAGGGSGLGIVLRYPDATTRSDEELIGQRTLQHISTPIPPGQRPRVAVIGAGNYAMRALLPTLAELPVTLDAVASSGGVSSQQAAKKFGFRRSTTDTSGLLRDPAIDAVIITTRHDTHVPLTVRALNEGKHVFVEKPLAIDRDGLDQLRTAYEALGADGRAPVLSVGFNRRFSPQAVKMRSLLAGVKERQAVIVTVNAGILPPEHWLNNPVVGGGRLIGEGCHFIDLARFLVGHPIERVQATALESGHGPRDSVTMTMDFADGSTATLHYLSNGHQAFPKERVEVFCGGRILQLDNFRKLRGFGWPGFTKFNLWRQDKGHAACLAAFFAAVERGGPSPVAFAELCEVTEASFQAVEQLQAGR